MGMIVISFNSYALEFLVQILSYRMQRNGRKIYLLYQFIEFPWNIPTRRCITIVKLAVFVVVSVDSQMLFRSSDAFRCRDWLYEYLIDRQVIGERPNYRARSKTKY